MKNAFLLGGSHFLAASRTYLSLANDNRIEDSLANLIGAVKSNFLKSRLWVGILAFVSNIEHTRTPTYRTSANPTERVNCYWKNHDSYFSESSSLQLRRAF